MLYVGNIVTNVAAILQRPCSDQPAEHGQSEGKAIGTIDASIEYTLSLASRRDQADATLFSKTTEQLDAASC